MKRLLFPLLILALGLFSCGDDDESVTLNLDGNNESAPFLAAGTYEAAVRFSADLTTPHVGKKMDKVRFWMGTPPARCVLKIYPAGTAVAPGSPALYTADLTNSINEASWHEHTITRDIEVTGEDVWVAVEFEHAEPQDLQIIGCDAAGSGVPDGDWLFQSSDNEWQPYSVRSPENINWNIRLKLVK